MNEYEMLPQQLQRARTEAGKSQRDAAKLLGCTAQAVSNWERGYTHIDCVSLFRLLAWYGADIYDFLRACGLDVARRENGEGGEERLLEAFRTLGETDRERLVRIARVLADRGEKQAAPEKAKRVIPLFRFLAAAGIPSPQPGEDYDDLEVAADSPADFAARIAGDSMEPWIHDGDVVYCRRTVQLADGDVGIFYANGGMVCKQFLRDSEGNLYLFSLNRKRRDADVVCPHSSDMALVCYGRVLLDRRIPLPED